MFDWIPGYGSKIGNYGNYGGRERSNTGALPVDSMDALFETHDRETTVANGYKNPIIKAVAWNTANKNLADGLAKYTELEKDYYDKDYGRLYRNASYKVFKLWSIIPIYDQKLLKGA